MAIDKEILKQVAYFSGFALGELKEAAKPLFEQSFKRGEIIALEAEPADNLYIVASGVVKLFKTSAEGKEQILYLAHAGDSFNDVPVIDGLPNPASAQAMVAVDLYGISKVDMLSLLDKYPRAQKNVTDLLAERIRNLSLLVEDLSFKHVIGRVAGILLKYGGDGDGPKTRLTQQDMAAMAGTAREVVGRSLKMLESDGTIKMNRHRIVISNKKALEDMVEMVA
ncbi:Crp/Fnr family transcriptional regulator [Chloroflexota bacterium]